jgi:hypothetical protein
MLRANKAALTALTILCLAANIFSQQFSLGSFSIESSPLIKELRSIRSAQPQITADEFVNAANAALERNGLGFAFYLSAATCEKLQAAYAARKPKDPPPALKATLNSVGGEKAGLLFPPPDSSSCMPCSVNLPALQVTPQDFITIISGRNIKFSFPPDLYSDEIELLDPSDTAKVKKTFKIPFRSQVLGVLYDENGLYISLPEPDLSDLALLVFDEGTLQFATKTEAESNGKAVFLDLGKTAESGHGYKAFQIRDKKLIVKYPTPCAR